MSNDDKAPGTDLALQIEKEIAAQAAALEDSLPEASGFNISTEGKMFTLPNGKSHPGPLEVIILDYINYNAYYTTAWKKGEYSAPKCWALNRSAKSMAPSENVPPDDRQHPTCKGCPQNEFGSAANGRGKACTNYVRLAITPADAGEGSEVMVLRVAPKGLTGWRRHAERVKEQTGSTPISVITEIKFNPNEVYPNLMFDIVGKNERMEDCYPLVAQARQLILSEPSDD